MTLWNDDAMRTCQIGSTDNGTQVIIEIQVHHQNFFINRLWAYLCSQVNQNLEKIRQQEGNTHQSYKHIAPVYAIAIVDSNYFSDDLAFHGFSMREDTTGEVLTITNNGQENHLVKMAFLELKKYRDFLQRVHGLFISVDSCSSLKTLFTCDEVLELPFEINPVVRVDIDCLDKCVSQLVGQLLRF